VDDILHWYREIWCVDFEFQAPDGERPKVWCLVAWELRSGRKVRLWHTEFESKPPYPTGSDVLFIAYYASAEIGCHLALGWPVPERILDLYTEFRNHWNGTRSGYRLVHALAHYGLDSLSVAEKDEMIDLAIRGAPFTRTEGAALLDYCESDVAGLARLLPAMLDRLILTQALYRGRYMAASARMEHTGVPIDTATLELLRANWEGIQRRLIASVNAQYGIYDAEGHWSDEQFAAYLQRNGIPWARLDSGALDLEDETFKEIEKAYPQISPLRALRQSQSKMRLFDLTVGHDSRSRVLLSAFGARTSRNLPSNAKFIFGPSVWLRGLIKPPPGHAVAYVDFAQQEFGIAAALSGDPAMQDAYRSGDPYLALAKRYGFVPQDATKESIKETEYEAVRELFKTVVLGIGYGMEAESLARRIGKPLIIAKEMLRYHRETFHVFWSWSDLTVRFAMSQLYFPTVFGWVQHVGEQTGGRHPARGFRNFPMQANGAEILRLACCLATERKIEVCCPVHDAMLICAPTARIEADVATTKEAMREASRIALDGFELSADAKIVRYPQRYMDAKRGKTFWNEVMKLIGGEPYVDQPQGFPHQPRSGCRLLRLARAAAQLQAWHGAG
jgi:hypothetical protein